MFNPHVETLDNAQCDLGIFVFQKIEHMQGMKVAVIEGHDIGGTCVNRGCVPSKALLAASGRVREMKNDMHMKAMGIQVGPTCSSNLAFTREHNYDICSCSYAAHNAGTAT